MTTGKITQKKLCIETILSHKYRLDWLQKEAEMIEGKIQFFDELTFKIKGWAITIWSFLISFALTKNKIEISLLALFVVICFLLLEASYKRYQIRFVERSREIMKILNEPNYIEIAFSNKQMPIYDLLGIYGEGNQHNPLNQKWGGIASSLKKSSVNFLYIILIFINIVIAFTFI